MSGIAGTARVLVAGVGNVLLGDDGFGVEVVRRLAGHPELPAGVRLFEAGIAGINLVQELMDGYDALVIVDAVDRGGPPGVLHLLVPEVEDLARLDASARYSALADMHMTTPSKALVLAHAIGVMPSRVLIAGCQPASCEPHVGLSDTVAAAVAGCVETLIRQLPLFAEHAGARTGEPGPA